MTAYLSALQRRDDMRKAMALVAGLAAGVTAIGCNAYFARDTHEAEAWRAHQAYDAGCVRHLRGGWDWDPCRAKAEHEAALAQEQIARDPCFNLKPNASPDKVEEACVHEGEARVGP